VKQEKKARTERKLTQLLSTHDTFMVFTSYYLWVLMDCCGFIIDDVQESAVFSMSTPFYDFVETFMNRRIQYMQEGNRGGELYCKMIMNSSYGFDGMNQEKYPKLFITNKNAELKAHMRNNYLGSRMVSDKCYLTFYSPRTYECPTCIQEACLTLDNAKYWYLNVLYNFMYRAFDFRRIHTIQLDTDCYYCAVAGDPALGINQGFMSVVKDKKFFEENRYKFFPNPEKGKVDEKKLLGMAIEKEGNFMIALAPKCYYIHTVRGPTIKNKGVGKRNKLTKEEYVDNLEKGEVSHAVNVNLRSNRGVMGKEVIRKVAVSGVHTKMVVLDNHSCAPIVFGINPTEYECQ
jgi:hypothetical protein